MRKRGAAFKHKRRDPLAHMAAIAGVKPLERSQQTDLGLAYRMALQVMRTGAGTEADFCTLACTVNVALVLAERGYGPEYLDTIQSAQDGLMRCYARGKQSGRWGLDGPAMAALSDALSLHDEQVAMALQSEMRQALIEVRRRVQAGQVLGVEGAAP